jgi:hypothetical protein
MPSANGQQTAGTKWQWSEIRNDQDRHEEAAALMAGVREHWDKGRELWRSLRYEAAQLDLLVGRPVRDVATALVSAHDQAWFRMNPNGAGVTPFRQGEKNKIDKLHSELVERTRADLGIDRPTVVDSVVSRRPRSLLAHLLRPRPRQGA